MLIIFVCVFPAIFEFRGFLNFEKTRYEFRKDPLIYLEKTRK